MPRGDGTGPMGQGPRGGRGGGMGRGQGRGQMGGFAMGPGGQCICTACGATAPHQPGVPCPQQRCPKCGAAMTRAR